MPDKTDLENLINAYNGLYDGLSEAYWAASTIETKDNIYGIEKAVGNILTNLRRADIMSRDDEFKAVLETVETVNNKLDKLKEQIDNLIHKVELASKIASAIDEVIKFAAKFLK